MMTLMRCCIEMGFLDVEDCLFDAFQVLLHFHYSSTELCNGLIDYFLGCLKNGDVESLESYEYNFPSDFLR
jgi:hypothetical protein